MFKTLYTTLKNRVRNPIVIEGPSKTIQEPKAMCDINNIVDLYCRSGRAVDLLTIQPWQEEDLTSIPQDYQECLEFMATIQEDFNRLPAQLRKEVGNNPLSMLKWITDPANKERGVELGLFERMPANSDFVSNDIDIPVDSGNNGNINVNEVTKS